MTNALKKKIMRVNDSSAEEFWETYEKTYTNVKNKATKNKKSYFKIQGILIYLSAVVSAINIVITLISIKSEWALIVPFLSAAASITTTISTILIKKRDFKKLFETWMRHSENQFNIEKESMAYLFSINEYLELDDKEALKRFKIQWLKILDDNYKKFSFNMSQFETEFDEYQSGINIREK